MLCVSVNNNTLLMTDVVFVTSVYDISRGTYADTLWRSLAFLVSALSGAKLYVWCSPDAVVPPDVQDAAGVHVCRSDVQGFACFAAGMTPGLVLPVARNGDKDTAAYMALMNSKPEMVARVADLTGHAAAAYAWMDAGAAKMWAHDSVSMGVALARLKEVVISEDTFVAPGCWAPTQPVAAGSWCVQPVCWRYCGTFFVVAGTSARAVCDELSSRYLAVVAEGFTTWEVNVWAQLEAETAGAGGGRVRFQWYKANHDSTLLDLAA